MKIGLFQMTGGTEENPVYEIGSPIFDDIEISLHPDYFSGKTLRIKTQNNTKTHWKVQKAQFNGSSLESFAVHHNELVQGGELLLVLSEN